MLRPGRRCTVSTPSKERQQSLAPTDWIAVAIDPSWLAARQADGRRHSFVFAEDDSAKTVTLTRRDEAVVLAFDRPDADHVALSGTLEGKVVDIGCAGCETTRCPSFGAGSGG